MSRAEQRKAAIARLKSQSKLTSGDDPVAVTSDIKVSDPFYDAVVKSEGASGTASFTIKTQKGARTVFGKSYLLTKGDNNITKGDEVIVQIIILDEKGDLPAKPWVSAVAPLTEGDG
jgi:hypothetical protein